VQQGEGVGEQLPAGAQFGGQADAHFVERAHLPFGGGDAPSGFRPAEGDGLFELGFGLSAYTRSFLVEVLTVPLSSLFHRFDSFVGVLHQLAMLVFHQFAPGIQFGEEPLVVFP
jgi:hypothetical protein